MFFPIFALFRLGPTVGPHESGVDDFLTIFDVNDTLRMDTAKYDNFRIEGQLNSNECYH